MNKKTKDLLWDLLVVTLADAELAVAVYFFLIPSKAAISSIVGVSMVLSNVIALPISVITFILNAVLLVAGYFACGRELAGKTVYATLLLSGFLGVLEKCFPDYTSYSGSQELDVICYVLIVSVGVAVLFNHNACTSGLDVLAKIINKYTGMEIGTSLTVMGIIIAASTAIFYDPKTVVLSFLGTYFYGQCVDKFIFGQNLKRRVCIISEKEEEIRSFILNDMKSGASLNRTLGAYTLQEHLELVVVVNKQEYQELMTFVKKTDPNAFVTVVSINEVLSAPKVSE
ncbi:MAG: YitT family protein [Firmicutes bacterium]|nr:YitT family protein [Bacillota bacterium]